MTQYKTKSVKIPTKLTDMSFQDMIYITQPKSFAVQCNRYLERYAKEDSKDFSKETRIALIQTVYSMLSKCKNPKKLKKIGDFKLPNDLLKISVGDLIELSNLEPDEYTSVAFMFGVFYKKEHKPQFSEEAILEGANFLMDKTLKEVVMVQQVYLEFIEQLKFRFPILFEGESKEDKTEGRKAYDILMTLCDNKFVDWNKAKNMYVMDAFIFLEEREKQNQLEANRKAGI